MPAENDCVFFRLYKKSLFLVSVERLLHALTARSFLVIIYSDVSSRGPDALSAYGSASLSPTLPLYEPGFHEMLTEP